MIKVLSVFLLSTFLIGCGNPFVRATDVIEKPRTCYVTPSKPELGRVEVEVQQLQSGEWAITIDDDNLNALLANQVTVDTYIEQSYNTLQNYESECNATLD